MNTRRYIIGFMMPFLALGILMFFLDAHGVFRGASLRYDSLMRMQRAYSILHWKPKRIILGTSTVAAIHPRHPAFESFGLVTLLNIYAAKTYELRRYIQHASATSDPEFIVLGIDFLHMSLQGDVVNDFAEYRFVTDADGNVLSPLHYAFNILPDVYTSLYAKQSMELLIRVVNNLPEDTFRRQAGYLQQALEPHERPFSHSKLNDYIACVPTPDIHQQNMENIATIIATLRQHDTRGYLFISPYHAYMIENIYLSECKEQYENMLRDLVDIIASDAAAHGGSSPVELWDFSMPGTLTSGALIPHDDDTFFLEHYEDLTHYYSTIGDHIVSRMFAYEDPSNPTPADFGMRLTPENIDAYLKKFERQVDWYRTLRQTRGELRPGESDTDGGE